MSIVKVSSQAIVSQETINQVNQAMAQAANVATSNNVFETYRDDKAKSSITAQRNALRKFESFLNQAAISAVGFATYRKDVLFEDVTAWANVTHGLVSGFLNWAKAEGHSIASINQRLSVIRRYSELADLAGCLPTGEASKIGAVKGITRAKARANVDAKREKTQERNKSTNALSTRQVYELFDHITSQDTETAKRDYLIAQLLFNHGLRSSEVVLISRESFDNERLRFFRPKIGKWAIHNTYGKTAKAYANYCELVADDAPFLQSAKRGQRLSGRALSLSSLKRIVKSWGEAIGVKNLSPHDARHTLATKKADEYKTADQLMNFFGWSSMSTAQRYVKARDVGNIGMSESF